MRTIGFPEKCGRLRAAALLLAIRLTMLWACPGALAADEAAPMYQADAPIRFSASDNAVWIASGNEVFQFSYNDLKSAADLGEMSARKTAAFRHWTRAATRWANAPCPRGWSR